MTTAIATLDDRAYMQELFAENMGGDALGMGDLVKVKVPSAGSTTWEIPVGENDMEPARFIEGVIIAQVSHRILFVEGKEGEKNPPVCTSDDGVTGYGNPGGACKTCPMAKFGSKGKGQACSARMNLYIMRDEDFMPIVIDLPPSSLTTLRKYMATLTTVTRKPFYAVRTRLTLKKVESSGGKFYSVVQFALVEKLDDEAAEGMKDMKIMFLEMLHASARQKDANDPAIQDAMGDEDPLFANHPLRQKEAPAKTKVVDADDEATF